MELQERKVSIEHGKARFAQCVCFLLFFGLTLKFQNHARVLPILLKIQAWCRKSWNYWFEHKQEHAYIYIYIFIHIYFIYLKIIYTWNATVAYLNKPLWLVYHLLCHFQIYTALQAKICNFPERPSFMPLMQTQAAFPAGWSVRSWHSMTQRNSFTASIKDI